MITSNIMYQYSSKFIIYHYPQLLKQKLFKLLCKMISMWIVLYFSTINENFKAFLCKLLLLKQTTSKITFGSLRIPEN